MPDDTQRFQVDHAQLIFRNFSGNPTRFNAEGGVRTFCVVLDRPFAEQLSREGWNVKFPENRMVGDEEEVRDPYIQVTVGYKIRPPRIVMITSGGRTEIHQDTVEVLDWCDIANCDLICNAYNWDVGGKTGITAYLKTMIITVEEDELEARYGLNAVEAEDHG